MWCIFYPFSINLFLFYNIIFSMARLTGPSTGSKCIRMLAQHFATIVAHYCTVSYIREWNAKVSKSETYILFPSIFNINLCIYITFNFFVFGNNIHVFVFLLFCLFWILPECLPVFSTLLFITFYLIFIVNYNEHLSII